jgi:hypothetical protein
VPGRIDNTVVMENVRIIFRNFKGREGRFNREGDRGFSVLLDDDTAKKMERDGWNVKYLRPREGDEENRRQPHLPVTIKYGKGRPPLIVMITSRGRTNLSEDEVDILDWADITNVDLIVRPYEWVVSGNTGLKAYLKSMFVTIEEDYLERKYSDVDDIPARAGRVDDPPF